MKHYIPKSLVKQCLKELIAESSEIIDDKGNEPFLSSGLKGESPLFQFYNLSHGTVVVYQGVPYVWKLSKFIPARQEIIDQYGGLTNDAVGAWIEDGNLPRAYVEVDELEKLEQEAAFKHRHGKQLMREFPDEFQTACECLEYGEGFGSWFSRVEDPDLTKEKAKILWKMAVAKVANED